MADRLAMPPFRRADTKLEARVTRASGGMMKAEMRERAGLSITIATAMVTRRNASVASPARPDENSVSTASTSAVTRAMVSPTEARSK